MKSDVANQGSRGGHLIKIQNIVATVEVIEPLDLQQLALELVDSEFTSEAARWLKLRLKPSNTYIAFYRSGKFLVTGVKSLEELDAAVQQVLDELKSVEMPTEIESIRIHNIVVMDDIQMPVNLNEMAISLAGQGAIYEPEQFPALMLRHGGSTSLVFSSGKIICTGNRSIETAERNLSYLRALLERHR